LRVLDNYIFEGGLGLDIYYGTYILNLTALIYKKQ